MPSSLWPLPSTPARPTISPGRTSRVKLSSRVAPWRSCTVRPSHTRAKPGLRFRRPVVLLVARLGIGERHVERLHLAADHGLDQRAHVGRRHVGLGDQPAGAQHGHLVGDLGDLGELVRHQDDGAAGVGDAAADVEQRADLRRRQHGGRLVEHQQLRIAHQALHDLGALALAHRQFADDGVGIEREAEAIGDVADAGGEGARD